MRKYKIVFCLLAVMVLLFCGCKASEDIKVTDLKSFSYEDDYKYYQKHSGARYTGFVNVKKDEVKSPKEAIELAKKECTIKYDALNYAYDSKAKVYRVCFYTQDIYGSNQDIYINTDGITQFIATGEVNR